MKTLCVTSMLVAVSLASQVHADPSPAAESFGSTSEVLSKITLESNAANLSLLHTSNPDGNLVLIVNRTEAAVLITSADGMAADLLAHKTMSWPCEFDAAAREFSLFDEDGALLGEPALLCGDAIYVLNEGGSRND